MLTNQTRYKTVCIIYVHKIKLVYKCKIINSSVELLSHVQLFVTPWTSACQVSLSITNSQREPTQTHVHCVSNAIQTSHSLSSPFPPCLLSFPASGSFPRSQFFASGGQSIGVSASASVLPMNIRTDFL